jgi:hypothetical protein
MHCFVHFFSPNWHGSSRIMHDIRILVYTLNPCPENNKTAGAFLSPAVFSRY